MTDRWDSHFVHLALAIAQMSKDPNTQVGAVIVGPDREIRTTGFNGLPRGIADSEFRLRDKDLKNKLVVHAELNAVLNAARIGVSVRDCTLYLCATDSSDQIWGGPPCHRCSVELIQAGIKKIVALPFKNGESSWSESVKLSRMILDEAGVSYCELQE